MKKCQTCKWFPCTKRCCNIGNKEACNGYESIVTEEIRKADKKYTDSEKRQAVADLELLARVYFTDFNKGYNKALVMGAEAIKESMEGRERCLVIVIVMI